MLIQNQSKILFNVRKILPATGKIQKIQINQTQVNFYNSVQAEADKKCCRGILRWEGGPFPNTTFCFMMGIVAEVIGMKGRVHILYLLIKSSALTPASAVFITLWFGVVSHRDEEIPALDPVEVFYY